MTDISRDSVIRFLSEAGGRVSNQHLVEHFRPLLAAAPPGEARTAARQLFKDAVNEVASVRAEDGLKYVCLRKKYRRAEPDNGDTTSTPEPTDQGPPEPADQTPDPGHTTSTPKPADQGPPDPHTPEPADYGSPDTGDENSTPESTDHGSPDTPDPAHRSPGYEGPPSISVTAEDDLPPVLQGRTPRGSRRGLREPVSPQLLRPGLRDSDSSSLHSSSSGNEEEEAAALEPREHAWMLSSCRARWDGLRELLAAEPGLVTRRDFITGYSCLHWAAKHGQHELLAALLSHARQHRVPVNINARASGGYTALHLAAMHGHLDVMKLLVGAYDADLAVRDYSGRKAWQYLSPDTARDVQALVGPEEEEDGGSAGPARWRLSRVLPSQLIVHRLSEDEQDGGRHISRKGSGRGRVNKIRFRTQIIHSSLSAREEDGDKILKSPLRHRPKSNVFG